MYADRFYFVRIENDYVGVGADCDRSLAWKQAKKFSRCRRHKLHEPVGRKPSAVHSARIHQAQPVLDTRSAVGNLGEVILAQFLLFLEAKGAMIGGDHLKSVSREPLPEFLLVPFFAQWRCENVFRAFESRRFHFFDGEKEILWARLRVSGQAAVPRLAHLFE